MTDDRDALGLAGERLAERFLRRRGLKVIARRFRTPAGELDLVMRDGDAIVFVEVKTQTSRKYIDPEQRVTAEKRRRMLRAARAFLAQMRWTERACRFDVVAITAGDGGADPQIDYFPDAFAPSRW